MVGSIPSAERSLLGDKVMNDIVIADVLEERRRQGRVWGKQNYSPLEWLPILCEEIGEISKEVCEGYFQNEITDNYRVELVQAAAVIVAMIENLDSGEEV